MNDYDEMQKEIQQEISDAINQKLKYISEIKEMWESLSEEEKSDELEMMKRLMWMGAVASATSICKRTTWIDSDSADWWKDNND